MSPSTDRTYKHVDAILVVEHHIPLVSCETSLGTNVAFQLLAQVNFNEYQDFCACNQILDLHITSYLDSWCLCIHQGRSTCSGPPRLYSCLRSNMAMTHTH